MAHNEYTMKTFSAFAALALCVAVSATAQTNLYPQIPATDAKNHIGETATVYGTIYHADSYHKGAIFDVDGYYPDAQLTVIAQFDIDHKELKNLVGKKIFVTGAITKDQEAIGIHPRIYAKWENLGVEGLEEKSAEQENADSSGTVAKQTNSASDTNNVLSVEELMLKAEKGDADSQNKLGVRYAHGQGVKHDYAEAAKWFRAAADQGYAKAQCNYGISCGKGQGVALDKVEAAKWFRAAADQGYAKAQYILGDCYLLGFGVKHDEVQAAEYFRRAAEQGYPPTNKIPSWWTGIASDPSMTNTFVTLSGKIYRNAKVTRIEPDGLNISFRTFNGGLGGGKISFEDLPLDIQQRYGYDAKNAAEYIEQRKQWTIQFQAELKNRQEQDRREESAAEAAAAKILYERAQQAYAQAKEDYDRKIQLASLQAQQRAALAQEVHAREAAQQTALMQYTAYLQQQQLYQQQEQNYQQQRTADGINNINQQMFFNQVFGR